MKRPKVRETMAGWRLGHRQSDAQHRLLLMISEAALSQGGSGHLALRSPPRRHLQHAPELQCPDGPRPQASQIRCVPQRRGQHKSWGCCLGPEDRRRTAGDILFPEVGRVWTVCLTYPYPSLGTEIPADQMDQEGSNLEQGFYLLQDMEGPQRT